jgi:hypothetical protein
LRTLAVVRDADVLDLGPIADEQLRLAGISWDGLDRATEDRLDGEIEDSFAGTLEHRVLGEANTPLFDVLRYAGDSGIIFATGTTKALGTIGDGRVQMAERRARDAIQAALAAADAGVEVEPIAATEETEEIDEIDEIEKAEEAPRAKKASTKKKAASAKKKSAAPAKKATAKKATRPKKKASSA